MEKELDIFIRGLPQIVPEPWCLKCKICCRFPEPENAQLPTWSSRERQWAFQAGGAPSWFKAAADSPSLLPQLSPCGSGYRCPAFHEQTNGCSIYSERPLDCRLYPFVLTKDSGGTKAVLSVDTKCPYIQEHGSSPEVSAYTQTLARYLETPAGLEYLKTNPKIIGPSWPEYLSVASLPATTASVQPPPSPPHPALQPLTGDHRDLLRRVLTLRPHRFSGYTPAGLFGWSDLIRHWWADLEGIFCLFAEQAGGLFMPLPPLGETANRKAISACWEILVQANRGMEVSRIEGIEPEEEPTFQALGFRIQPGESEYLYRREDLAALRGDRYRSQRGGINRFRRQACFIFRPFQESDLIPCLQLYTLWGIRHQQKGIDSFPKQLIRDGLFFHRRLMMSRQELGLTGRVLELEKRIVGYTFGAPVSPEIFCIFAEITDRKIPGSAAFIFREFCRELEPYALINAMGDEGLPGLKQAKISYRPIGFASAKVATRGVDRTDTTR